MGIRLVCVGRSYVCRLIGSPCKSNPQHAKIHDWCSSLRSNACYLLHHSLHERCYWVPSFGRRNWAWGCWEHLGMAGEMLTIVDSEWERCNFNISMQFVPLRTPAHQWPSPKSLNLESFFFSLLEPSLRTTLVWLRICCRSNSLLLIVLRLELLQCMESARRQENSVKPRHVAFILIFIFENSLKLSQDNTFSSNVCAVWVEEEFSTFFIFLCARGYLKLKCRVIVIKVHCSAANIFFFIHKSSF